MPVHGGEGRTTGTQNSLLAEGLEAALLSQEEKTTEISSALEIH